MATKRHEFTDSMHEEMLDNPEAAAAGADHALAEGMVDTTPP